MPRKKGFGDEPDSESDHDGEPKLAGTKFSEEDDKKNKFRPNHMQEVYDENGKRRFHGAFTGGWAAGYFNTVGSKEGWTPSTFVSSRESRAEKKKLRPEDIMDAEDLKDYTEAGKTLVAKSDYELLGDQEAGAGVPDRKRKLEPDAGGLMAPILDELVTPSKDPVGKRLLRLMGWREGKGAGPLREREIPQPKPQEDEAPKKRVMGCALPPGAEIQPPEDDDEEVDIHAAGKKFAPDDVKVVEYKVKNDFYGVGYDPHADAPEMAPLRNKEEFEVALDPRAPKNKPISLTSIFGGEGEDDNTGAFGLGAYEEDDDANVFGGSRMAEYDIEIGDEDDAVGRPSRGPQKRAPPKPAPPTPRPAPPKQSVPTVKLPGVVKGFVPAKAKEAPPKHFEAPPMPNNFTPRHVFTTPLVTTEQRLVMARNNTITNEQRAVMLGEKAAPVKGSVFDLLTPEARARLAVAIAGQPQKGEGMAGLPANLAAGLPAPPPPPQPPKLLRAEDIPDYEPFKHDVSKQERYRQFLLKAMGNENVVVDQAGMTEWEKSRENDEFQKASAFYRPMADVMKARFVHGGQTAQAMRRPENDANVAARAGMYGRLTRKVEEWRPSPLLCKRMNVMNPFHGMAPKETKASMETHLAANLVVPMSQVLNMPELKEVEVKPPTEEEIAAREDGELIIPEKPPVDIFKAIFEADDDAPLPPIVPSTVPAPVGVSAAAAAGPAATTTAAKVTAAIAAPSAKPSEAPTPGAPSHPDARASATARSPPPDRPAAVVLDRLVSDAGSKPPAQGEETPMEGVERAADGGAVADGGGRAKKKGAEPPDKGQAAVSADDFWAIPTQPIEEEKPVDQEKAWESAALMERFFDSLDAEIGNLPSQLSQAEHANASAPKAATPAVEKTSARAPMAAPPPPPPAPASTKATATRARDASPEVKVVKGRASGYKPPTGVIPLSGDLLAPLVDPEAARAADRAARQPSRNLSPPPAPVAGGSFTVGGKTYEVLGLKSEVESSSSNPYLFVPKGGGGVPHYSGVPHYPDAKPAGPPPPPRSSGGDIAVEKRRRRSRSPDQGRRRSRSRERRRERSSSRERRRERSTSRERRRERSSSRDKKEKKAKHKKSKHKKEKRAEDH